MRKTNPEQIKFIEDHFGVIYPAHISAFTRLMVDLRAKFDGDLDLLLILTVIGERTRSENWKVELSTYRHLTDVADKENAPFSINVQSIADYTGIPRETVRRKTSVLQRKGWVMRDAKGRLAVSPTTAPELEGATTETISYLAALLKAVDTACATGAGRGRKTF